MKQIGKINSIKIYKFFGLMLIYGVVCITVILTTSFLYTTKDIQKSTYIPLNKNWEILFDGNLISKKAQLPYIINDSKIEYIEMTNTIPETEFLTDAIVFSVFQKNLWVYLDDTQIYVNSTIEESKGGQTPGSSLVTISLPQDSQGKKLKIVQQRVVSTDMSKISEVKIIDGSMNSSNRIPVDKLTFVLVGGFLTLGILSLFVAAIYISMGTKIIPIVCISIFIITSSLWVMCNSKMIQIFSDNWILIHNIEYISFFLMPLCISSYVYFNWEEYNKYSGIMMLVLGAFNIMALTAKVFKICDFFYFLKFFHIMCIIYFVVFTIEALKNFKNKPKTLKFFYLGFFCMSILAIMDFARYYIKDATNTKSGFFMIGLGIFGYLVIAGYIYSTKEGMASVIENKIYKVIAYQDALTGLGNRAKFEKDMAEIENNLIEKQRVTLLVSDINDLKKVNDARGHMEGDRMIQSVAEVFEEVFKNGADIYRIGGDEFYIVIKDSIQEDIEEKISEIYKKLTDVKLPFEVTVSCGHCKYKESKHKTLMMVFKEADDNMYENKARFKNRI